MEEREKVRTEQNTHFPKKKKNYSLGFLNLRLDLTKISVRVHAHVKEVRAWLKANVQAVTNNHKTSRP